MSKYKPFVLPVAIILGLLLHSVCAAISFIVPYIIFSILTLTFSSIDLIKLRFSVLDVWLCVVQVVGAVAAYFLGYFLFNNVSISQGLMMGFLCPVASSVTVVATMLGAKHNNTIAYTIVGNLLVSIVAPLLFLLFGNVDNTNLVDSFLSILGKVSSVIGLPFFLMLILQLWVKPAARIIKRYSGFSFYLWAIALLFTLGQTIDFIFLHGRGNWNVIIVLAQGSIIICAISFGLGRIIGKKYDDTIAGQQLLGQKNTAMGIWMSNTYLSPLSSTILAFYSICQNLLNSYQIWRKQHNANVK